MDLKSLRTKFNHTLEGVMRLRQLNSAQTRPVKSPSFICPGWEEGKKADRKGRSDDIDRRRRLFIFPPSISHARLVLLLLEKDFVLLEKPCSTFYIFFIKALSLQDIRGCGNTAKQKQVEF